MRTPRVKKQPAHVVNPSKRINFLIGGGEEIPKGGWRTGGGEEIPKGGWRKGGGEEIPKGGWRTGGGEEIPKGGWRKGGGEEIPKGGWRTGGGEEIPKGGWRKGGGEEIPKGGWRTGGGEEIPKGGWRKGGGEEIPKGGWRAGEAVPEGRWQAVVDTYRTKDGEGYFKFRFYPLGDYVEIDILAMPSFNGRPSDLHTTHRLPSDRGGYKICFGDPMIVSSIDTARKWAAMWSEHIYSYIRYGTPFPNS